MLVSSSSGKTCHTVTEIHTGQMGENVQSRLQVKCLLFTFSCYVMMFIIACLFMLASVVRVILIDLSTMLCALCMPCQRPVFLL